MALSNTQAGTGETTGRGDWHGGFMSAWNSIRAAIGSAPLSPAQQREVLTPLGEAIATANAMIARYECSAIDGGSIAQPAAARRGRPAGAQNAGQSQPSTAELSDFQQKCIGALNGAEGLTAAQIAAQIGSKPMTIGRALGPLVKKRSGPVTKRGDLFYLAAAEATPLRKTG